MLCLRSLLQGAELSSISNFHLIWLRWWRAAATTLQCTTNNTAPPSSSSSVLCNATTVNPMPQKKGGKRSEKNHHHLQFKLSSLSLLLEFVGRELETHLICILCALTAENNETTTTTTVYADWGFCEFSTLLASSGLCTHNGVAHCLDDDFHASLSFAPCLSLMATESRESSHTIRMRLRI